MDTKGTQTDVDEFLDNVSPGFKKNLSYILSEAAATQVLHGVGNRKSKIDISVSFSPYSNEDQLMVTTTIKKTILTSRGKKIEDASSDQVFFIGKGGVMTINRPDEHIPQNMRHIKPV